MHLALKYLNLFMKLPGYRKHFGHADSILPDKNLSGLLLTRFILIGRFCEGL